MQQPEKDSKRLLPSSSFPFHPKNCLPAISLGFKENPSDPKTNLEKKEPINIAMGFDVKYAIHSLTALASLFGTTKQPENLQIYLLHCELFPQELQDKFFRLAPSPEQIHFILIDNEAIKTLPIVNEHITLASYYRLLLPELINLPKILWIDGDTIVCDDIAQLWQEDLTGFAFGAVPDLSEKKEKARLSNFYSSLEKDPQEAYINSGVSLYNLDLIRKTYPNFLTTCQTFIQKNPGVIELEDQDLLNLLFIGKIKNLPLKWNLYSSFFHRPRYFHYFSEDEVKQALLRPGLIHYASPWNKPWKTKVRTKTKGLYWYWRHKTNLPPRDFKEWIAQMLSPCYYVVKNNRHFLQIAFILLPWVKISTKKQKSYLGKWQGFFL